MSNILYHGQANITVHGLMYGMTFSIDDNHTVILDDVWDDFGNDPNEIEDCYIENIREDLESDLKEILNNKEKLAKYLQDNNIQMYKPKSPSLKEGAD